MDSTEYQPLIIRENESTASTVIISSKEAVNSDVKPKKKQLDFQNVDFIATVEAIQKLIRLPYQSGSMTMAIHRIGRSLIIEEMKQINNDMMTDYDQIPFHCADRKTLQMALPADDILNLLVGKFNDKLKEIDNDRCDENISNTTSSTSSESRVLTTDWTSFLPPAASYMAQFMPTSVREHIPWQLGSFKFSVGSNLNIYSLPRHPSVSIKKLDLNMADWTVLLDSYLENVIANVQELAICFYSRDCLRGIRMCRTSEIHKLFLEKKLPFPKIHQNNSRFDIQEIETNAIKIFEYLRNTCTAENGTYILTKLPTPSREMLTEANMDQLLHIQCLSSSFSGSSDHLLSQDKWKWLYAMSCHRFAVRLSQQIHDASPLAKVQIRERQISLYNKSYQLLTDIHSLGRNRKGIICSALLEQLADIHLSQIDLFYKRKNGHQSQSVQDNDDSNSNDFDSFNVEEQLLQCESLLKTALIHLMDVCNSASTSVIRVGQVDCLPVGGPIGHEEADDEESVNIAVLAQYSGLLHKLCLCVCNLAKEFMNSSRIFEAVDSFHAIFEFCQKWIQLTRSAKRYVLKEDILPDEDPFTCDPMLTGKGSLFDELNRSSYGLYEENIVELWNIDQTIAQFLPLFCEVCGALARLLAKIAQQPHESASVSSARNSLTANSFLLFEMLLTSSYFHISSEANFQQFTKSKISLRYYLRTLWNILCGTSKNEMVEDVLSLKPCYNIFSLVAPIVFNFIDPAESSFQADLSSSSSCGMVELQSFFLVCKSVLHARKENYWSYDQWIERIPPELVSSEGSSNKTKMRKVQDFQLNTKDVDLYQTLRKLGDSSNELGQMFCKKILNCSNSVGIDQSHHHDKRSSASSKNCKCYEEGVLQAMEMKVTLSKISSTFYDAAFHLFIAASDLANAIHVLCNVSSLYRLVSTSLSANIQQSCCPDHVSSLLCSETSSFNKAKSKKLSGSTQHGYEDNGCNWSPLHYLQRALITCENAHTILQYRRSGGREANAWDLVSLESANSYLSVGILHRSCAAFATDSINNSRASKVANVKLKHIKTAFDNFLHALRIFKDIQQERHVAAANFQLGSLTTWCVNTLSQVDHEYGIFTIDQCLSFYRDAQAYFIKYDVGPTLATILVDMCALNLNPAAVEEPLIPGGTVSGVLTDFLSQYSNQGSLTERQKAEIMRLDLALDSILCCRFTLTPAVLERHSNQMLTMVDNIQSQLCVVLKKTLKVLNESRLPEDSKSESEVPSKFIGLIKRVYGSIITGRGKNSSLDSSTKCLYLYESLEELQGLKNVL